MKNYLKKSKLPFVCLTLLIVAMIMPSMVSYAAGNRVYGKLNTYVHYLPILADEATAITSFSMIQGTKSKTVYSKTTAYAKSKSGKSVTTTKYANGIAAIEGWSKGQAKASIVNMKQARGTHMVKANTTNNKYITAKTNYNR